MSRFRWTTYFFLPLLCFAEALAQQDPPPPVALEQQVAMLTTKVGNLETAVQALQLQLDRRDVCNAQLEFYSPNDPAADTDGCVPPPVVDVPFVATLLETVTSNVFVNPDEVLMLDAVIGAPTHLKVTTHCATLGNNGFSTASISLLNTNGDVILSLTGCSNAGVSNGESTAMGNGKIVPLPAGAAAVALRTRLSNTVGGQGHNSAVVTVDVLGLPSP